MSLEWLDGFMLSAVNNSQNTLWLAQTIFILATCQLEINLVLFKLTFEYFYIHVIVPTS